MTNTPAGFGGRAATIVLIILGIIVIGAAFWTWFSLSWSYSEGERAGVLQKFSNKGWVCKTWEGELAQYVVGGVSPQIWHFSTRDEELAKQLMKATGERVQIHYTEHKGIPTNCFADTPYFAQSFRVMSEGSR